MPTRSLLNGKGVLRLQQAEWGSRSYAATGVQDYVLQSARELGVQTNIFAPLELSPPAIQPTTEFDRLMQLVTAKRRVMEHLIALRRDQGHTAASEALSNDEGLKLMTEIRALTDEMEGNEIACSSAPGGEPIQPRGQAWRFSRHSAALGLTLATSWFAHGMRSDGAGERAGAYASLHSRNLIETSLIRW